MRTQLLAMAELLLSRESRPAGPRNALFVCPFHDAASSQHGGWSFTVNIYNGKCQCLSCKRQFSSLKQLAIALGRGEDAAMLAEIARMEPVESPPRLVQMTSIPEFLVYVMGKAYAKLPQFSRAVLDEFEVRYDAEINSLVYPIRDKAGRLVRLHCRSLDPYALSRYRFFSHKDYDRYGLDIPDAEDTMGKHGAFVHGHKVIPAIVEDRLNSAVLVEGPKQAMRVWEAGYHQVIAMMGGLGYEQLMELQMLEFNLFALFDNDKGGEDAWAKLKHGMAGCCPTRKVSWMALEKRQPDDLTHSEVRDLLTNAGVEPWDLEHQ